MSRRSLKDYNLSAKKLAIIMNELKENIVFAEGKKDREALSGLGVTSVFTISGNLRATCESVRIQANKTKIIVLTDLDRRGDELAKQAVGELERYGINANIEYRKILGGLLNLRHFEDINRKYLKFIEEEKNNR